MSQSLRPRVPRSGQAVCLPSASFPGSPLKATVARLGACMEKPVSGQLHISRGSAPGSPLKQAPTSHEDVLSERETVGLAEFPASQVDQEVIPAVHVEQLLHLPRHGGRQAVVVKVLRPRPNQPAALHVLDGGEKELQGEEAGRTEGCSTLCL